MSLAGKQTKRRGDWARTNSRIKQLAWVKGEDGDGQMDGGGKSSRSEGDIKQSSKYKFAIEEVNRGRDRSR